MQAPTGTPASLTHPREERDRLLARVAFEAVWELDLDTGALSWDQSIQTIFGYPREEVVHHISWWRERVHRDDIARVEATHDGALRGGAGGWANEYRFRRKDESWAWVCSRCAIERDA